MRSIKIFYKISQICKEDVRMAEDIYGPSVPPLQIKTFRHKIKHVKPIIIPNFPQSILDKFMKFTLCCDLIHINGIGFINTIYQHMMFATGIMIKNRKVKNI